MKKYLYQAILAVIGLSLSCISVLANQIGFAHNTEWGSSRIIFLVIGLSILGISLFGFYFRLQRIYILTTASILFVLGVYVFIISTGKWITIPESSQHYDELATAFRSGHLYLDIQPPAALLVLPDPYDPQARKSDPVLVTFIEDHAWDLSVYHGRFYMYWGPAPALLLLIIQFIYSGPIGDQVLAFIFSWLALIFQTLLLIRIWIRFFPYLPGWTVPLGITTVGLLTPTIWMLNMPRIYQAAIFSCQFFLIAGIYFAYTALEEETIPTGKIWVAGILWALAIASRATLLGSVLFLICTILIMLIRQFSQKRDWIGLLSGFTAAGFPLLITMLALGWYNIARFGSIAEFGLRYQLTLSNINKIHDQLFSLQYILPNLYNYTVFPFQTLARFPFIKARAGIIPRFLNGTGLENYQTEDITGILFSAPFLLFVFGSVISLTKQFPRIDRRMQSLGDVMDEPNGIYQWISISLLGASIISFSILLITFYITMRYIADFTFTLAPLAVIGFWQGFSIFKSGLKRIIYSVCGILLSWLSISISVLIVISSSKALLNIIFNQFRHLMNFFR